MAHVTNRLRSQCCNTYTCQHRHRCRCCSRCPTTADRRGPQSSTFMDICQLSPPPVLKISERCRTIHASCRNLPLTFLTVCYLLPPYWAHSATNGHHSAIAAKKGECCLRCLPSKALGTSITTLQQEHSSNNNSKRPQSSKKNKAATQQQKQQGGPVAATTLASYCSCLS